MCLIVFDWRPGTAAVLRLAANRDEFHDRPSAALATWDDAPGVLGGRDLRAGGTWLAVHERGRLAAVTNVRDPELEAPTDGPSRGALVRDALECDSLAAWLERLAGHDAAKYAGFNLLASDGHRLWHLHRGRHGTQLEEVAAGLHGLSNASLDTPWPKLERSRARLGRALAERDTDFAEAAWALLADTQRPDDAELPDTGVGLALERRLAAPFILGDDYGTRVSTWITWHADGEIVIGERSFGPGGRSLGECRERMRTPALKAR